MPWSPAQHRLFCAAAKNPSIARKKGLSQPEASKMCHEGVKKVAEAMAKRKHVTRK